METNHIYDALEGRVLGGEIRTKKIVEGNEEVVGIAVLKNGEFIRDPSQAASVLIWLEGLMSE